VCGVDGNIVAVSLDGKTRRQLTHVPAGAGARHPAWSPDGKKIVYVYAPPLPATSGPGGLPPLPTADLYVMNADGSDAKPLRRSDGPGLAYETPAWSPDGLALFVTYTEVLVTGAVVRDAKVEVARVALAGGPHQTLIPDAMVPTISPDGRRLACLASRPYGEAGQTLLVAAADGTGVRALRPSRLDGFAAPRFSPDGTLIAFARNAPPTTSGSPASPASPPAPSPRPATPGPFSPPRASSSPTDASPGMVARALARLGWRPARAHGLPMDIHVCGVEGDDFRRLTDLGEDDPVPSWSPDGRRIAFSAGGGLYVMNADGSDLTRISPAGGQGGLDWKH
jgi:TolB protein